MTDKTKAAPNEMTQTLGIIIFAIALLTTLFTVAEPGEWALWILVISVLVMILAGYYAFTE